MWSSFQSIFRKELIHIMRDRGTLVMALVIPLFQLVLFGFIDQTVHDLPTVVVDQDRSQESRELMDKLRATKTFLITEVESDPHAARKRIISGEARVAIVIPPDYHNKRTRAIPAKILVLIDGSDSTASAQALAAVSGLTAQMSYEEVARRVGNGDPPISSQPVVMFNPTGRTANYILPGLVAIVLQFVAVVLAAVAIVREREKGTLEQLLVTPIHPLGLMLGKLGPYLVLSLIEMGLIIIVMRFVFQVPIQGSVLFLFAITPIYLFALLALGLLVSTRAQTQAEALQAAQMTLLPSIFLSGYIFPFEGLPWFLQLIGQILPATHMVAIMRGVVLRNAGIVEMLPHVLAMTAFSAVVVFAAAKRFKKVTL